MFSTIIYVKKKIQMDLIIFDVRLEGHVTGQGYEK